jgi:hypothetical protein
MPYASKKSLPYGERLEREGRKRERKEGKRERKEGKREREERRAAAARQLNHNGERIFDYHPSTRSNSS